MSAPSRAQAMAQANALARRSKGSMGSTEYGQVQVR
jgi:hypothetical protein